MILATEVRMVSLFPIESSAMGNSELLPAFIESSAMSDSKVLPALMLTNLTCKEDFFQRNFTCLPSCDHWDERPRNFLAYIDDIVQAMSSSLRLLLIVLLFVMFAMRRKVL